MAGVGRARRERFQALVLVAVLFVGGFGFLYFSIGQRENLDFRPSLVRTRFAPAHEEGAPLPVGAKEALHHWLTPECDYEKLQPLTVKLASQHTRAVIVVPGSMDKLQVLDYRLTPTSHQQVSVSWSITQHSQKKNGKIVQRELAGQEEQLFTFDEAFELAEQTETAGPIRRRYFLPPNSHMLSPGPIMLRKFDTLVFDFQLETPATEPSFVVEVGGCATHAKPLRPFGEYKHLGTSSFQLNARQIGIDLTPRQRAVAEEIKYWKVATKVSPRMLSGSLLGSSTESRYVTFESDLGAFNNKRIHFETVIYFCLCTGRTLVMPPLSVYGWSDYFDMEDISRAIHAIPSEDFVRRMLQVEKISEVEGWDPKNVSSLLTPDQWTKALNSLSDDTVAPDWRPGEGTDSLFWPKDGKAGCDEECQTEFDKWRPSGKRVEYNTEMQQKLIFHFTGDGTSRLLVDYQTFIGFEDPLKERDALLTMRNYVHFREYIFDIAAKVISRLPPSYGAMHVRRGDLQYQQSKAGAEVIYENTKALFKEGETMYIATDEKDKTFFNALAKHYKLVFFGDFPEVESLALSLPGRNGRPSGSQYHEMFWSPDSSGMVEAVIASMAHTFVGTWLSTFSSIIGNIRGFHSHINNTHTYFTIKHYTGKHSEDIIQGIDGHLGYGFHWQEHFDRRFQFNDWQYTDSS